MSNKRQRSVPAEPVLNDEFETADENGAPIEIEAGEQAAAGTDPATGEGTIGPLCFTDRELSWLQFNLRVLKEAGSRSVPLLERLKFLSIYYSNLDEFFMVRVGSLIHRSILLPDYVDSKTGWNTETSLRKILKAVEKQQNTAEKVYRELLDDLKAAGIEVMDFHHSSKVDESMAKKLFAEVRPLLAPRIVDAQHPMPFLGNREEYVAALIGKGEKPMLGLVSLYRLPKYRVFEINGKQKVAILSDVVSHFAPQLFKKCDVREACVVRVTRNADIFFEDNEEQADEDFRASMEKLLRKRKREMPVRLQMIGRVSQKMSALLTARLNIPAGSAFISGVPTDLSFGSGLVKTPEMNYPERKSVRTVHLHKGEYFRYLEQNDLLLSFPYQSITPFIEMLYEAADDPDVVSIRITLYRLAASSKLAAALAYAADQGKDVLCLLELRARFDEQNNIDYSEVLEDAGCSVIYGLPDKKVHSKICLITRKCGDEIKYITQIGTGNYNEVTSEQYCDLSLITSDPAVGKDAAAVFEALSLGRDPGASGRLIVAPKSYKPWLLDMLDREKEKGEAGFVALKANSMNDLDVMTKLIECSRSGCRVELFIRGICCLRPGLPGYTENVTVRSVVGRYLEHSRVFVFGEGDAQRVFIGSGDLLNRNTQRRVEAFIEVVTPDTKKQVLEVMDAFRADREKGSLMQTNGSYRKEKGGKGTASQERLAAYFSAQSVEAIPEKKQSWLRRLFGKKKRKSR